MFEVWPIVAPMFGHGQSIFAMAWCRGVPVRFIVNWSLVRIGNRMCSSMFQMFQVILLVIINQCL